MATKVRVEFGDLYQEPYPNMLQAVPSLATQVATLSVTTTATVAGSRPVVPTGASIAIITAVDGNVIVAPPGANPTAVQTTGKLCLAGMETPIFVLPGQLLSFIELA